MSDIDAILAHFRRCGGGDLDVEGQYERARLELADLRRRAQGVDVEARRLVDALTANGEHEWLIEPERVESLPDELHNDIVLALRALRRALARETGGV